MSTNRLLLSLALCAAIIWGLLLLIDESKNITGSIIRPTQSQNDTLTITRYDTIRLTASPQILYESDTVYITRAFTATVDTTIGKLIWQASYRFPEHRLEIETMAPDTLATITTVYDMEECGLERTALGLAGGTAFGLLVAAVAGG